MSRRSARVSAQSSDMRPPRRMVKNRVVDSESETESGTSDDDDEQQQQQQPTTPYKSPSQKILDDGMDLDSPFKENNNKNTISREPRGARVNGSTPLQEVHVNKTNRLPLKMQEVMVKLEPAEQTPQQEEETSTQDKEMIEEPKPTAPLKRLVLKNLILTNFKSYAGRQVVGPFHSSFSAVVGPNGSGKSNVIDSLLFVFGFRASKMRQAKISALIHHSDTYPNLEFCSVDVCFEDVYENGEIVEGSSLVISRKAFKNNTSKYTINGQESSYTQVTELLRDRGIDLDHKRFLILQGEVESIAQMKPKAQNENDDGLLEYLEDIIGTAKYKKPIEEAAQEVETLTDVCMEKTERLNIVEGEKDKLEDKAKMVLKYLQQENELTMKQSELLQAKLFATGKTIQVTTQLVQELEEKLQEEKSKHKDDQQEMGRLEQELHTSTQRLNGMTKELKENTKSLNKFESQRVQIEEQRKHMENKVSKLAKMISQAGHSKNEAETWIKNYKDELIELERKSQDLETQLEIEEARLNEIRVELSDKTRDFSNEIEVKQRQLEPWTEKINVKKSQMAVAQSELEILKERGNSRAKGLQQVEEKIAHTMKLGRAKERQLASYEKELARVKSQIELGQGECKDAQGKLEIMRRHLSEMGDKTAEAKASLLSSETQGKVLSALVRLTDTGRLNGFHGRLGDLGTIDEKYNVAISTACPQLNNLVVDNVEVGQQCIEHLRKNNLGRAVLILLDRLAKRDLSPIATPENVPRLFDLIKPKDEKFRPAFYSVVQDTLVAQDLAQANRIAYGDHHQKKRWRVVTISGEVIDKSGTMSGGGTRVSKGGMKNKLASQASTRQVEEMEKEKKTHEQTFDAAKELYDNMVESLKELQEQEPEVEVCISKLHLEIKALQGQLKDLELEKGARESEMVGGDGSQDNNDEEQVRHGEMKVAKIQQEIQDLERGTMDIEKEIERLQEKIMEMGGVRLRSQNSKVEGIHAQIQGLQERMSLIELSKAKGENELSKSCGVIEESLREQERLKSEMEEMEGDLNSKLKIVAQLEEAIEEGNKKIELLGERVEQVKSNIEEGVEERNRLRGIEIEVRNRIRENEGKLGSERKRQEVYVEELKKLKLHSLDDDEEGRYELQEFSEDEVQEIDIEVVEKEINRIRKKLEEFQQIDEGVLQEYKGRMGEFQERRRELNEWVEKCDGCKRRVEELRKQRLEEFMAGFSHISKRLKEMYRMITIGGNAELELVDSLDPFSEGILFSVMPPKKSWKNISNLSGGEKTLSSLALVFALHQFKPTPIYVMDEIDAALDFRNVSIIGNYIKQRTEMGQFIVISLRNNMFELAHRLIGIYKVNHMTKSVTLNNQDFIYKKSREKEVLAE